MTERRPWTLRDARRVVGRMAALPPAARKVYWAAKYGRLAVLVKGGAVAVDMPAAVATARVAIARALDRAISRYGPMARIAIIDTGAHTQIHGVDLGVPVISPSDVRSDGDASGDRPEDRQPGQESGQDDAAASSDGGHQEDHEASAPDRSGQPDDGESSGSGNGDMEPSPRGGTGGSQDSSSDEACGRRADDGGRDAHPAAGDGEQSGGMGSAGGRSEAPQHPSGGTATGGPGRCGEDPADARPDTPGERRAGYEPAKNPGPVGETGTPEARDQNPSDGADDRAPGDEPPEPGEFLGEETPAQSGGGYSPYHDPDDADVAAAAARQIRAAAAAGSRALERLLRRCVRARGREVPLVDERRLVGEIISRRYAIGRAHRRVGRPRPVIVTPDGSGSCRIMIRVTMPAVRALQREMGEDVIVLAPNSNGCPMAPRDLASDWPSWLRDLAADADVGEYAYVGRPVRFWSRALASGLIAAVIYLGDDDADDIWRQVDDRRVIAIRERTCGREVGATQTIDIDYQAADLGAAQYLRCIARAIDRARITL